MMTALRYVLYTEMILLFRQSREWLYPLSFFIMVVGLFPLAFSPDPLFIKTWFPGFAWIAALFANILSIQTIFISDTEDGHLEQLLLTDIPLPMLITIKLFAQWLGHTLPVIVLTPLLGLLFGLSFPVVTVLALSLLLGTPLLTLLGGLAVALTISLPQKGILLSLLILPLIAPLLIFGIAMVNQFQVGIAIMGPLAFLAGLSLFGILILPMVIAAAIRIGVDD